MYLQDFIINNDDYLSQFRKLNLNVKNYSQLKLAIITYKRNFVYDFNENTFIKWCKGAIINTETNKVVCLPPQKCLEKYTFSDANTTVVLQRKPHLREIRTRSRRA